MHRKRMTIIISKQTHMLPKKLLLLLLLTGCISILRAQQNPQLDSLRSKIESVILDPNVLTGTKFKTIENLILNEPGVYNEIWARVYNNFRKKDDRFILKNLKIDFKTFQATDSNKTSLGFSYKYDYDINKKKQSDYERTEFIAKINAEGNIAFKKELNPMDFQSAKLNMGSSGFFGGTVNKSDSKLITKLNAINQQLAAIDDEDELARSPLWDELTSAMGITNQYHYDFAATGGWEGKQDFKTSQLTYGAQLRFTAKSYSDKNALAQLNLIDYPFALIRYLTGTSKSVNPYGAALPIVTLGIDIVNPQKDTLRKSLTQNDKSFTRFRVEANFRTLIADINNTTLYFNAAYRYFRELNAPAMIKAAGLQQYSYFSMSVTAADNYFFSYAYGKLPFDRTNNAMYSLGFKFNL